jgi:hypothetical protein
MTITLVERIPIQLSPRIADAAAVERAFAALSIRSRWLVLAAWRMAIARQLIDLGVIAQAPSMGK